MTTKTESKNQKQEATTMTTETTSNPFDFGNANATLSTSRKLDLTPELINTANARAIGLITEASKNAKYHELANKMLDGNVQDLLDLINQIQGEHIVDDAKFLSGASEDELSRLLESRRSDRSKAKAKGLRSSIQVTQTYVAAMYAELLVRQAWNKPYTGNVESHLDLATADKIQLDKKIASLSSKASRLRKLAKYDAAANADLKAVEAEIERINKFRPNSRSSVETVLKSASIDQLRDALKSADTSSLSEEEQAKLQDLMAKLG